MQRPYGNTWGSNPPLQPDIREGQRSRGYAGGTRSSGHDLRSDPSSDCSSSQDQGGSGSAVNVFELLQQALNAVKNPPPVVESAKRHAPEADSVRVEEAKKPRYDPMPVSDYSMNDSAWNCSRCGSANVAGRDDCVKCNSSRQVQEEDYEDFSMDDTDMNSKDGRKRKLFVHGLLPTTTTIDLFKYFSKWGPMDHVYVKTDDFGVSKGFGFVHYLKAENADTCLAAEPHFIQKKRVGVKFSNVQTYTGNSERAKDLSNLVKMGKAEDKDETKSALQLQISNLAPDTTAEQLFCHFVKWGNIASYKKPGYSLSGGRISFVTFAHEGDAIRCLAEKHVIDGREVIVRVSTEKNIWGDVKGANKGSEQSQGSDPRPATGTVSKRLEISGMTPRTSNDQLLCYFSRWGGIEDYEVEKDTTGRKTGKGFVRFGKASEAQLAMEARPHVIDGKMVKVALYVPKERTDTVMQSQKATTALQRRSPSPKISIPGLNLTETDLEPDDDPVSQRKYVCKVSGCFFKAIQNQFDQHWYERHEPKVKYLICAFCSMGCVDEDALVEHLDFFHGVEDNTEMAKLLMDVETEDRNNTQYIMPGNVTRYSCMELVDSEQDLPHTASVKSKQSSDDDVLRCNEYGCTFTGTTDEFLTHWNKEHLMELIYLRCPMCPKTFQKKTSLQFHIEHVHQNKGDDKYDEDDRENDNFEAESDERDQYRYPVTKPESRISTIKSRAEMEEIHRRSKARSEQSSVSRAHETGTDELPSKHIPTISGMGARNTKSAKVAPASSSDRKLTKSATGNDTPVSHIAPAQTPVAMQRAPGYIPSQALQKSAPPLASQLPAPTYSHSVTPIMPPSAMNIPSSQTIPAAYPPPLQAAIASAPQRVQQGNSVTFPPVGVPPAVGAVQPQPLMNVAQRLPTSQHAGQPNFMPPVQPFPRSVPFAQNPQQVIAPPGTVMTVLHQPIGAIRPPPQVMGQPHVISAPPQLINAQPQVTGSHVISAPPQLISAPRQVMPPPQIAPRQQLVQPQHLPRPKIMPLQGPPQPYPNLQHMQNSVSSGAPNVVSSTTNSVSNVQSSDSSVPSAYPGVIGVTKSADLATWYKKVTDSVLLKASEEKKSKDSDDAVQVKDDSYQKLDVSAELMKSLKKDTVTAERPKWPQKLKESSPLPSMRTIREKRKSPKKGRIFKPPSIVIPAFKRSSCDSIKTFLTWNEHMIKRLECANLHARKKLKVEMDEADEDSVEESDEEISSDEEKEEKNKSEADDLLDEMKKKAEAIAEKLLEDYKKNVPKVKPAAAASASATTDAATVTGKQGKNLQGQKKAPKGKKKKVKESAEEKQLFGKLVGRAMGMAKRVVPKSAKGDPALEARAMAWARQKLLHLKAHCMEQTDVEQQLDNNQMDQVKNSTKDAEAAGTSLQQGSHSQEEHVAVYVDERGKEDEEYTLAYIDEGGVHVMDEGYILGEEGPMKRENAENSNSSQEFQNNRERDRDWGRGREQGGDGGPRQDRTGQRFEGRELPTAQINESGQRFTRRGNLGDEGRCFMEGQQMTQENDGRSGVTRRNINSDNRTRQGHENENMVMRNENKFGQEGRNVMADRSGFDQGHELEQNRQGNDRFSQGEQRKFRDNFERDFEQREDDEIYRRRNGTSWQDNRRFRGSRRDNNLEQGIEEDQIMHRNLDRSRLESNRNFRGNNREIEGPMEFRQQGRFRNYNRSGQRGRRNFVQESKEVMQEDQMRAYGRGGFRGARRGGRWNDSSHKEEHNWQVKGEWNIKQEKHPDEEDERFSDEEFFEFREDDRMSRGSGRSSKYEHMRNEDWRRHRPYNRHDRGASDQRIVQVVHDEVEDFPEEEPFQSERIVQIVGDEMITDNRVGNFDRTNRYDRNFNRNSGDFRRGGSKSDIPKSQWISEDSGEKESMFQRKMGQIQENSWSQSIDKMSPREQERRKGRSETSGKGPGRASSNDRSSSWSQSIEKMSSREQERSYSGSRGKGPGQKDADKRSSGRREDSAEMNRGGKNTKQDSNNQGKKWGSGILGESGTWNSDRSRSRRDGSDGRQEGQSSRDQSGGEMDSMEDEFPEDMSEFVVMDVA